MNAEQILDVIKSLSLSQGFYGRLLRTIDECPDVLDDLVAQNFGSELDLILYIES